MKNKFYSLLLACAVVAVAATAFNSPAPAPAASQFKNLQVLPKDISKHALDSIMDHFKISLGVKCNFCHSMDADTTKKQLDFSSDANHHKDIARDMMRMTTFLNVNYYNENNSTQPDTIRTIVCYTCHRGAKEPDSKAFLMQIDSTLKSQRRK